MEHQFGKYDRQLRMWGEEGQHGLQTARVCLLNGGALGSEILKNLVLPGIASFTVVDGRQVAEADLGNSFFVTESDLGRSRAQAVTEALKELNPDDVEGNFVDEDPSNVIATRPEFFGDFSLIIATQLRDNDCLALSDLCLTASIPLITTRTYGFFGVLSIVGDVHTVVESKPDFPMDDMRLSAPFPELLQAIEQTDLSELNSHEHAHVPYPIILHILLKRWIEKHGAAPATYPEKKEFKRFVAQSARGPDDVNYQEAAANSLKLFNKPSITSSTRQVLDSPLCDTETGSRFWVTMQAVRDFVADTGQLPLTGVLPDVTATPARYQALQTMYKAKAAADAALVLERVRTMQEKQEVAVDISDAYVAKVCRCANEAAFIKFGGFSTWSNLAGDCVKEIGEMLNNDESAMHVLVGAWAAEHFHQKHLRLPGDTDGGEGEMVLLTSTTTDMLSALSVPSDKWLNTDVLGELCRSSASEVHTAAAIMGGVASQEAIKLITHQYVPVDNCFVFDGIRGTSAAIRLY